MKIAMTVLAAALALAGLADGEKAKAPRQMMGPAGIVDPLVRATLNPKLAEKLGLTEDQRARLKAIDGEKGAAAELQKKVRAGMERQAELLKAEKIDESAVMAVIDEVWEARKELAKRQTRRLIAVKAILTPEQVAEVAEQMKAMKAKRGEGNPKKAKKVGKKADTPQE